jgi:hypothetical protein
MAREIEMPEINITPAASESLEKAPEEHEA